MGKIITGKALFSKQLSNKDRILLVNPPAWETRYSWLRWNQPLDLLQIGSHLRSHFDCHVELLDCMKPDKEGSVREEWLPRDRRYRIISDTRYPMRRFGEPHTIFKDWLEKKRLDFPKKLPTQVWITSLCSYWFESIAEMCRVVRQSHEDAKLVLVGQYPRLLPEHALETCAADLIVSRPHELQGTSAFDLYGSNPPPFVAVGLEPSQAIEEIKNAVSRQIYQIAFFSDNICCNEGKPLAEIVEATKGLHKHLRFHAICGLYPSGMNQRVASALAGKHFAAIHFEEDSTDNQLNIDAYRQAVGFLDAAGVKMPDDRLSGFVWIGRPLEQLEQVILRGFQVVDALGGLILKPFSPTPGGPEHETHQAYLDRIPPQNWSPHFFPFAELNGISRDEYHDLYRMAAFLNEKVRNRSFDFLKGTLGAQMLRESLAREVWKIGPSPLRLVD